MDAVSSRARVGEVGGEGAKGLARIGSERKEKRASICISRFVRLNVSFGVNITAATFDAHKVGDYVCFDYVRMKVSSMYIKVHKCITI